MSARAITIYGTGGTTDHQKWVVQSANLGVQPFDCLSSPAELRSEKLREFRLSDFQESPTIDTAITDGGSADIFMRTLVEDDKRVCVIPFCMKGIRMH